MFCTDNAPIYIPPHTQHYTNLLYDLEDRLEKSKDIETFQIYRDSKRNLAIKITLSQKYEVSNTLCQIVSDSNHLLELAVHGQRFPRAYLQIRTQDCMAVDEFPDNEVVKS